MHLQIQLAFYLTCSRRRSSAGAHWWVLLVWSSLTLKAASFFATVRALGVSKFTLHEPVLRATHSGHFSAISDLTFFMAAMVLSAVLPSKNALYAKGSLRIDGLNFYSYLRILWVLRAVFIPILTRPVLFLSFFNALEKLIRHSPFLMVRIHPCTYFWSAPCHLMDR